MVDIWCYEDGDMEDRRITDIYRDDHLELTCGECQNEMTPDEAKSCFERFIDLDNYFLDNEQVDRPVIGMEPGDL